MEAIIVVDIGFGDAGKGSIVDYLARQASSVAVVRYNGGPQAAHNVVTPDGRHHTFAQLGSGMFVPGVTTHLSRFMLVNPMNLSFEIDCAARVGIDAAWQRVTIDRDALIVTPWHVAANRIRELARGDGRHGSCGQGVGEAQSDALEGDSNLVLRAGDLQNVVTLAGKIRRIVDHKRMQLEGVGDPSDERVARELEGLWDDETVSFYMWYYRNFAQRALIVDGDHLGVLLRENERVIFEGAQGVLLDEWFGFHPYTTWSTTTSENALELLGEQGCEGDAWKLGVTRGYGVRHGPGPFPTEDTSLTRVLPEAHNGTNDWQRGFRVGRFDAVLGRYAVRACGGIDELAVTNLDRMFGNGWSICAGYEIYGRAGICIDLGVNYSKHLGYQERLGRLLDSARPVYGQPAWIGTRGEACDYASEIACKLGVHLHYTSFGATAADKSTVHTSVPLAT
jgi:adenylosuccinate synthase